MKFRSFHLLALLLPLSLAVGQETTGIQSLYRLDSLPRFKDSVSVGAISSYDRTGGNDDGFSGKYSFVRKDPEGLVLADLKGPGVIYRVWTPTPTDETLEFLFDGETSPRIQIGFRELFLGKNPNFPAPLSGFGAGGYYCYVPIPFAKSCVVRLRADKAQFYQINYALYPPQTSIATYKPDDAKAASESLARAREFFLLSGGDVSRFGLPPGASPQVLVNQVTLEPNQAVTLFQTNRGGRIIGLRLTPTDALIGKARDLVLKVAFDQQEPAVLCPLGDFFGYAWGQPAMQSLLVGTTGSTNYCYFPMPFKNSAQIQVLSERAQPVQLRAEIVFSDAPQTGDEGTFYAVWRRENPTRLGQPYTFLETAGRGHLVGVILQAQGMESGKTLFFEGDDCTHVDGELAIHGTGSEDFFNGGWYDVPDRWEKRISFPLSGCLGYSKHLGRTGAYRLFLGDACAFRRRILQTIEHAGNNNEIPTDYASVAFFYSDQAPAPRPSLPPLADRGVHDPREIIFPTTWQTPIYAWSFDHASLTRKGEKIGNEDVRYLSLRAEGGDWFGPHFIAFTCEVPEAGLHSIYIEAVKGPAQARVQLFQNENPIGEPIDLYAASPARSGRLLLGKMTLSEGRNNIMLKLVDKNENSTALGLDITQLICVREP